MFHWTVLALGGGFLLASVLFSSVLMTDPKVVKNSSFGVLLHSIAHGQTFNLKSGFACFTIFSFSRQLLGESAFGFFRRQTAVAGCVRMGDARKRLFSACVAAHALEAGDPSFKRA